MDTRFAVSLWGADYARTFCDVSLPSQLAPGNLPTLVSNGGVGYAIYTDTATRPVLEDHRSLAGLRQMAEVEIFDVAEVAFGGQSIATRADAVPLAAKKHELQSLCYMHALDGAAEAGAVLFPLAADMVFSATALAYFAERARAGKKAVMANFLRLTRESAEPALSRTLASSPNGLIGRELCAIAFDHLHPVQQGFDVERGRISEYPIQLTWTAANGSLLVRGLFPHPMAVRPTTGTTRFDSTIDYDYAFRIAPDAEDIELARDSDDATVCRLSPGGHLAGAHRLVEVRPDTVAAHIVSETNRRHLEFFGALSLFHTAEPGEPELDAARRSAAFTSEVVDAIRARVEDGSADGPDLMTLKSFLGPVELYLSPQRRAIVDAVVKRND